MNRITITLAGVSSALILDELVYLMGTDGSDAAYLTSISFWGAAGLTIFVLLLIVGVYYERSKLNKRHHVRIKR
ncbi:hypothetical protein COV12_03115 [Candidatus Woesearchaeota archaeon CG10_big_fil_rev_8_21_14_0_10_32_24]|nr:MAG: hypothetical protein COV12_03115 [Candidatus Woesearchaeota archaeon CG10_big_fil_rev_8_21_14_0_10_32_24]